ncbi:hypothetical protein [Salinispora arenicola]|uniref:hypothetical protein n=1 Tax=Salinispora arenicola TaxID=168697 RepID=UPI000361E9FF|nr:hypothetical protein [Salinispora arenicola]
MILNTAVKEDELIRQNPCRIPGYDRYRIPERPVATVAQVLALAGRMPPRLSALVIVAAFSGLSWQNAAKEKPAAHKAAQGHEAEATGT